MITKATFLIAISLLVHGSYSFCPSNPFCGNREVTRAVSNDFKLNMIFGGNAGVGIPKSSAMRDTQAIESVKAAIKAQKSFLEIEFPALEQLNKLGDGSLRSAKEAEQANLAFLSKLVKGIKPLPFMGPNICLVTSSAASKSFQTAANTLAGGLGITACSLRDGIPAQSTSKDIILFLNPSSSADYTAAANASKTAISVIINGFAKVRCEFMKIIVETSKYTIIFNIHVKQILIVYRMTRAYQKVQLWHTF